VPAQAPATPSTQLVCLSPVPADIDIAQAVQPRPITEIASKIGLAAEDYEQYGPVKAKASHSLPAEQHCTPGSCNPVKLQSLDDIYWNRMGWERISFSTFVSHIVVNPAHRRPRSSYAT
jgi:hypothetical protein